MKVLAIVLNVRDQEVNVYPLSIEPESEVKHPLKKAVRRELVKLAKEELTEQEAIDWKDNGNDDPPQLTHLVLATNWIVECRPVDSQ